MSKSADLVIECKRLSEACLYTSTSLFEWLKSRRRVKTFFTVTPLALGGFAGWRLLTESDLESVKLIVSAFAFLAGLFPTIYAALKFDDQLSNAGVAAAEFKNLQDRFRQAALIGSKKPFVEFEKDFAALMDRLEAARQGSLTPPESFFQVARRKIKAGDYEFEVDIQEEVSAPK